MNSVLRDWDERSIKSINHFFLNKTKPINNSITLTEAIAQQLIARQAEIIAESTEKSIWDIEIHISGDRIDVGAVGLLFQSLNQALVSDVETRLVIEHIRSGSLFAKFRLFFSSLFSEKHAENVIAESRRLAEKGYKAAESKYLDNPIEEAEHLKAQREKLQKETELLQSKQQLEELRAVELKTKEIEYLLKQEELLGKRIDNIKKGAELLALGIDSFGDIEMKINGNIVLKKEEGKFIE